MIILAGFSQHSRQPTNSFVRAFILATGIRVINKHRLKDRAERGKQRVMNNSISDQRLVNVSLFWILNPKVFIWPMLISSLFQFVVKLKNVFLKLIFKFQNIFFLLFPALEFIPSGKKIVQ